MHKHRTLKAKMEWLEENVFPYKKYGQNRRLVVYGSSYYVPTIGERVDLRYWEFFYDWEDLYVKINAWKVLSKGS